MVQEPYLTIILLSPFVCFYIGYALWEWKIEKYVIKKFKIHIWGEARKRRSVFIDPQEIIDPRKL